MPLRDAKGRFVKRVSPDFEAMFKELKKDLVTYAAVTGLNFFKDSFTNQGFTDQSFEAWPKRKDDVDPGRAILIKSSFLRDALEVISKSQQRIVFGNEAPYSAIHNDGGTITVTVTDKMKKYFWWMYKKTGVDKFKNMAMMKTGKQITIHIPQRKFIGESATLMAQLDTWVKNEIVRRVALLNKTSNV